MYWLSGSCTIPCDPLSVFFHISHFQNLAEIFVQKFKSAQILRSLLAAFLWDQGSPERAAPAGCACVRKHLEHLERLRVPSAVTLNNSSFTSGPCVLSPGTMTVTALGVTNAENTWKLWDVFLTLLSLTAVPPDQRSLPRCSPAGRAPVQMFHCARSLVHASFLPDACSSSFLRRHPPCRFLPSSSAPWHLPSFV